MRGRRVDRTNDKVFGIGLSRTGTTSLNQALQLLGFRSVHFPADPVTRFELGSYFRSRRASRLELSIVRHVDALTDTPTVPIFRELSALYPSSRFIMTTRPRSEWLDACDRFWSSAMADLFSIHSPSPFRDYVQLINSAVYGRTDFARGVFSDAYDQHLANVRDWFSHAPSRLLELNLFAGEGWGELCRFLNRPVPAVAFPHVNTLEQAKQSILERLARQ